MLRRFAALIFILTVAANVWAGVCECIEMDDSHAVSSCCKRDHANGDSFSTKPCCESACAETSFVPVHRTQTESTIKIPLPSDVIGSASFIPILPHLKVSFVGGVDRSFVDLRLGFPRPPNLYLRHHSFLI